jgi:hypothetical protein
MVHLGQLNNPLYRRLRYAVLTRNWRSFANPRSILNLLSAAAIEAADNASLASRSWRLIA